MNYKIRSKEGKGVIVQHNSVKACSIPFNKGEHFALLQSQGKLCSYLRGFGWTEKMWGFKFKIKNFSKDLQHFHRPAGLRQVVRSPLRFGDFVTH